MGRRSDHTRAELRELIVAEGFRHMEEVGFARFSAREVAKRIGYSIGTLYNVFGSYDGLIFAINGRTLALWRDHLAGSLAGVAEDRLKRAIRAYFEFATAHRHAWAAIYDFRLPPGEVPPDDYKRQVWAIFELVVIEVASALPDARKNEAKELTRSLLASVHGHCVFALNGTFANLGEPDPQAAAWNRVREAIGL